MRRTIFAMLGATALIAGTALSAQAQAPAQPGTPAAKGANGVNVGSLNCTVAGGVGFIFGSTKDLDCILVRDDGIAEHYKGQVKKFGVDIGFTKEAHIVWLVFAPGKIGPGAIAGDYAGATASATVGVGIGANVLVGGSNKQITLQPVSVEGSTGLNVAAGIGQVTLTPAR
jgi:uncharacterized protein DUF992